jgi:hypothetical protein
MEVMLSLKCLIDYEVLLTLHGSFDVCIHPTTAGRAKALDRKPAPAFSGAKALHCQPYIFRTNNFSRAKALDRHMKSAHLQESSLTGAEAACMTFVG